MVGITLSPEEIHGAPPEVRRWLEQKLIDAFGTGRPPPPTEAPRHLVGCSVQAVRGALALVQHILPVVSVFFELAREPAAASPQGLRVLHLDDMMRHCRLQSPAQVVACLEAIDQALQQSSGDAEAVLTVVDSNQHVLVPDATARSIHTIWEEIVAHRHAAQAQAAAHPKAQPSSAGVAPPINAGQPFQPYSINVSTPGGMPSG